MAYRDEGKFNGTSSHFRAGRRLMHESGVRTKAEWLLHFR